MNGIDNQALQISDDAHILTATDYKGVLGSSSRTISFWFKSTTHGNLLYYGLDGAGQKLSISLQDGTGGANMDMLTAYE